MEKSQAFRIAGSTAEIEYLSVDHIQGQDVIFWEEIKQVFPRVHRIRCHGVILGKLKNEGVCYDPPCIKHHPNEILDIELFKDADDDPTGLTMSTSTLASTNNPNVTGATAVASNSKSSLGPIDMVSKSINELAVAPQIVSVSSSAEPRYTTLTRRNTENIQSVAEAIELANQSGQPLSKEQLVSLIRSNLSPTLQARSGFEHTVIRELGAIHDQGATTQQIALKVYEIQKQMNDRLILIQKKTEAILTQQVELAEYPIPRLFIVLPEELKEYDPANWFRTKFRLHFICECGEHTQPAGSNVAHHLHLAKHEGYLVREPTAFFKKYGPFLMLMLEMIKIGSGVASHVVPALATLKVADLVGSAQQSIASVTSKIDYSLKCIDKEMEKLRSSSLGELSDTDNHPVNQQDLTNYLSNVEALEGVELRQLGSFLKSNADNLLGNLYRMTTADGYVKWVCRDHYRTGYQEAHTQKLRDIVQHAKGRLDEQLGTVDISLKSSFAAVEFFDALAGAKGILELIVDLDWACTRNDVKFLHDAVKKSSVAILHVDLQKFQPSRRTTFLLMSGYESLYQIVELSNLESVHLVLPHDIIKPSNFTPRRLSSLRRLTFEMVVGRAGNDKGVRVLSEILENNSTTISLYCSNGEKGAHALFEALTISSRQTTMVISYNSIGEKGAQALSEALKTNSTLTSLNILENRIGEKGVQALSEALKTNSTLITLEVRNNSIGEKGAQALSEALKTNSTLTTLDISCNSISQKGAQALSEALKINLTLTILDIQSNSIREEGAQALSGALKTNSTLTTLNISYNSIGEKGAQALSEALKTNSMLTTLDIRENSIGEKGAQALSEVLKTNTTLSTLRIGSNSIRVKGAQALSEVLKTNSTLTSLDIGGNWAGDQVAQVLSEALKTNSTLITLEICKNSIGEKGAQALFEALKTNSTLTTLDIKGNSIGDKGAQALSQVLKTNSTLTTLDMGGNSIGEKGAQALSEALKTNSTLTSLDISYNTIGEEGAQAISEALKTDSTLTTLNITGNLIEERGIQALFDALKTNSTLTNLDISYGSIREEGAQVLSEPLNTNSMLTTLNTIDNSIGENEVHTIVEAVNSNAILRESRGDDDVL